MPSRTFTTGFGAFGAVTDNPSATLAKTCGRPFRILEVSYAAVDEALGELDPTSFDQLLLMGVASKRNHLSVELFARNWIGRVKDVRGAGVNGLIEEGAPLLLESTLWNDDNSSEIVAYDPRMRISMDAGDYLCNYVYYRALQRFPDRKVGFLHVPGLGKMPLADQASSLARILEVIERP